MLSLVLKLMAPVFVLVGLIHVVLGVEAELLLGASLPPDVISDPALDSQNRFYGAAFSAYGFLFFVCAGDLDKHRVTLRVLLGTFFAAGCARLVSIAVYGMPPAPILVLLVTELVLPPALAWWHARTLDLSASTRGVGDDVG
tara:strand:- start:281 stop:706 length:426 start_codon:yes stop_codon:yes gene_type:complete